MAAHQRTFADFDYNTPSRAQLQAQQQRIRNALGFSTDDPYADAVLYRERFETWRWKTVRKLRDKGLLP